VAICKRLAPIFVDFFVWLRGVGTILTLRGEHLTIVGLCISRVLDCQRTAIMAIMGLVALIAGDELDCGRHSEDDDEWHFQHNIY